MTLNMMTLMALSLAIGLLIDDAIVVRENIVRHLEHGAGPLRRPRAKGTSEIGLAVLATSMSIIAVFVPVAFMKGIVGRFFFQFGLTVAFAVLVSLFVSFTLDPMLSSRWYDPDIERQGQAQLPAARRSTGFNAWFERTADGYKRRHRLGARPPRVVVVGAAIAAFVGGPRGVRRPADRVHDAHGPGRVRGQVQERARAPRSPRRAAASTQVLKALERVHGGAVHLRLDRRRRRGHRARRDGLRQARGPGAERSVEPQAVPRTTRAGAWRRSPGIVLSVQEDPDAFQKPLADRRSRATTSRRSSSTRGGSSASCTRCPASSTSRRRWSRTCRSTAWWWTGERAAATGLGSGAVASTRRRAGRRRRPSPPTRTRKARRSTCACACRERCAATSRRSAT